MNERNRHASFSIWFECRLHLATPSINIVKWRLRYWWNDSPCITNALVLKCKISIYWFLCLKKVFRVYLWSIVPSRNFFRSFMSAYHILWMSCTKNGTMEYISSSWERDLRGNQRILILSFRSKKTTGFCPIGQRTIQEITSKSQPGYLWKWQYSTELQLYVKVFDLTFSWTKDFWKLTDCILPQHWWSCAVKSTHMSELTRNGVYKFIRLREQEKSITIF
jgi:hypothetical protein